MEQIKKDDIREGDIVYYNHFEGYILSPYITREGRLVYRGLERNKDGQWILFRGYKFGLHRASIRKASELEKQAFQVVLDERYHHRHIFNASFGLEEIAQLTVPKEVVEYDIY